jgi:hypothetical protein
MTILIFLLLTAAVFAAWWIWFAWRRRAAGDEGSLAEHTVYAGLFGGCQIVLSEIVLGALMLLQRPLLIALNVAISAGVAGAAVFLRKQPVPAGARVSWRELCAGENLALLGLLGFAATWIGVATWLLPPRGIDDVYHLPPLYQYLRQGGLSLLPLELRDQFAAPFNGEFLFLWPLVMFHADTWIDGVQFVVGLYAAAVIYALARCLGIPWRESAFAGLLFPFVPVVLGQAGSNYVDLTVAACQLVLIYAVVRYWQTGALAHLLVAGCATGFGIGMKYNMLITIAFVQPVIWTRLLTVGELRSGARRYLAYVGAALPLGSFWIARNLAETGHALYPFRVTWRGLRKVSDSYLVARFGERPAGSAFLDFLRDPASLASYAFSDLGLGSFHGGFGVVFWGLALPALLFCSWGAVRLLWRGNYFPAWFWGYVPIAFLTLFLQLRTPRLQYDQRYIIVVVALGLLALGHVLHWLRDRHPVAVSAIRLFGIAASVAAVVQLAAYQWPNFRIMNAVSDRLGGRWTSEYRYLREAPIGLPALGAAWDPLDFLTRGREGWGVYVAVDWPFFWSAPTFGSRVQNRVWNFEPAEIDDPQAFVYYQRPGRELLFIGAEIPPDEVAGDPRYELVTVAAGAELWVQRRLLDAPGMRARQAEFYRRGFGAEIPALEQLIPGLGGQATIVTSHPLGHALRYLELAGQSPIPVRLVPTGREAETARRAGLQRAVSIGDPLPGFEARRIAVFRYPAGEVPFFENVRVP